MTTDWLSPSYPNWIPDQSQMNAVLQAEHKLVRHMLSETETHLICTLFFFSTRSSEYFRRRPCGTWARFEMDKITKRVEFVEGRSNNRKAWSSFRVFLRWLPA